MTDLRTDIEFIFDRFMTEVIVAKNISEKASFYISNDIERREKALTAILKLIKERYVAVNGTDYVFDKEKHDKTYITRQEAYEKAFNAVFSEINKQEEERDTDKALRTAFKIPEGKE